MDAYGWVVLRASREPYLEVDPNSSEIDELDDRMSAADRAIAEALTSWLEAKGNLGAMLSWSINRKMWVEERVIVFTSSQNHRASWIWDLLEWIIYHAPGSYGLVYVHDDEDLPGNTSYGRGQADYSNQFRVFRVLNGKLDELDDPFLSPIFPTVNPISYC